MTAVAVVELTALTVLLGALVCLYLEVLEWRQWYVVHGCALVVLIVCQGVKGSLALAVLGTLLLVGLVAGSWWRRGSVW